MGWGRLGGAGWAGPVGTGGREFGWLGGPEAGVRAGLAGDRAWQGPAMLDQAGQGGPSASPRAEPRFHPPIAPDRPLPRLAICLTYLPGLARLARLTFPHRCLSSPLPHPTAASPHRCLSSPPPLPTAPPPSLPPLAFASPPPLISIPSCSSPSPLLTSHLRPRPTALRPSPPPLPAASCPSPLLPTALGPSSPALLTPGFSNTGHFRLRGIGHARVQRLHQIQRPTVADGGHLVITCPIS